MLLKGEKKVEVRKYPLKGYKNEDLWVVETQGKVGLQGGKFVPRVIGKIRFETSFEYQMFEDFRADESRQCIVAGSEFDWSPEACRMYGWEVAEVHVLRRPVAPPAVKGQIGSKAIGRRSTFD